MLDKIDDTLEEFTGRRRSRFPAPGLESLIDDLLIEARGMLAFDCPIHPDADVENWDEFDWNNGTGCRYCARDRMGTRKRRTQKVRLRVAVDKTEKAPAAEAVEAEDSPDARLPAWQKMGL